MKKVIALLLICFVLVNVSFLSANADSDEINNILQIIKPRIPYTDEYDEFSSSVSNSNGEKQYRFSWSKTDKENGGYDSLNVGVNSKGIIVSYDFYNDKVYEYDDSASVNRISSDEALNAAEDMIKNLNPDMAETLKLSKTQKNESLYSRHHTFNVQRYENSLPVIGNNGSVTLSHDAKTLLSFYINYDDITFPDTKSFISREKAVDSFFENFGMTLKYADNYSDGNKKVVLQYEPKIEHGAYINEYISAVDGSVVRHEKGDELYRFAASDSAASLKEKSEEGGSSSLTETEIKEIEKISGLMSVSEAEKAIRLNEIIDINDDYILVQSRLNRDYADKNKYIYNLRFECNEEDEEYPQVLMLNVYLDASSGKITRFYKSSKYSEEKNISEEEATKKIDKAVKILAPEHFDKNPDFLLEEKEEYNGNYYYTRYVNGIEYVGNSISVSVNLYDGSISSYSIYYDEHNFPSADGVITEKDACLKLFEQIDYSVKYLPVTDDKNQTKAVPVYASEANNFVIDAFTGKLLHPEADDTLAPYADIKGHYAEDAINTLAKFGIGFDGGSFNPDINIKQQDFVALLTAAFSYRHPVIIKEDFDYTVFYSNAKNNGIVKEGEYAPEQEITRMEAAVMLIRAIGAEEVAELEDVFVPVFADVSSKKGYIAILNGMDVIKGDEYGNFNPRQNLSRADAAIMLYNYLSK